MSFSATSPLYRIDSKKELELPPGFRFNPSDQELIDPYLINKVMNLPLPFDNVKEVINIYKFNPQKLAESYKKFGERYLYFFSRKRGKYQKLNQGCWRCIRRYIQIRTKNKEVGYKKTLVFHRKGKGSKYTKTGWIMQEYSVHVRHPRRNTTIGSKLEDWVLCKIYKMRSNKSSKIHLARNALIPNYESTLLSDNNSLLAKIYYLNGINDSMGLMIGDTHSFDEPLQPLPMTPCKLEELCQPMESNYSRNPAPHPKQLKIYLSSTSNGEQLLKKSHPPPQAIKDISNGVCTIEPR